MSSPSVTEVNSQLQAGVELLDNSLANQTVEADLDAYEQTVESNFAAAQSDGAATFRRVISDAFKAGGAAVLTPILRVYTFHLVNAPETDVPGMFGRIYDYFHANNYSVKSRGATFGAWTAAGTGNGVFNRCTVDHRGYKIEAFTPEVKTAVCIRDGQNGTDPHKEAFEIRGQAANTSSLSVRGSGIRKPISCVAADSSLLANPSFESFTAATQPTAGSPQVPTDVTDWVVDTIAKTQVDVDRYYQALIGVPTPTGLRFNTSGGNANNGIQQALSVNGVGAKLPGRFTPTYLEIAVYRESNADGTFTLQLGNSSTTFSVSSLTNSAWNVCRLTDGTDTKAWPLVWNVSGAFARAALSANTTGTIVLDDFMLVPYFDVDGTWLLPRSGSTRFVLDDTKTSTDTISSDSKIQKWLWKSFGRYLPHRANATQVVGSGGQTLTFANVGSADTITRSSGSFVTDGYYAGMIPTVAGTVSNNGTKGPIATVSATVLTFGADTTLVAEGPLSTGTIDATPSVLDPT
jgi:hypothetical protein